MHFLLSILLGSGAELALALFDIPINSPLSGIFVQSLVQP